MWVQVIQGKVNDAAGLMKQLDRWNEELRPNASGFLGSTGGVTDDGEFIMVARFESEELAMRNSDNPRQSEWWNETVRYFDGEPIFRNCSEVDTMRNGGSDDAGFVQVIQSKVADPARLREIGKRMQEMVPDDYRPDYLGGISAWDGEVLTQTAYFPSEAEAREGERQDNTALVESNPELGKAWEEMGALMQDTRYFDLREPRII